MIHLCLGTYLSILKKCKKVSCTQKKLVGSIMELLDKEFAKDDDSMISNLVAGRKNPCETVILSAASYNNIDSIKFSHQFNKNILISLDPNKLAVIQESLISIVESDRTISEDCIIIKSNNISKANIRTSKYSISDLLSGLLLYTLATTDNRNKSKDVKSLDDKFFRGIHKKLEKKKCTKNIKEPSEKCIANEETYLKAQEFCINHEKELDLLPLCQIANAINPMHNYYRKMYTDFCKCSREVKKYILEHNSQISLKFDKPGWVNRCVETYENRIIETKICTHTFLYEGAKYFHQAFYRYSNMRIHFDPWVFNDLYTKKKCNLASFIYNYIELKKNKSKRRINPPLDDLWNHCCQMTVDESEVTYWVCHMIISSCYLIEEKPTWGDENDIRNISLGDGEMLIQTQEDMYLYALLELYKYYYK